jgi:hypothetical protein
MKQDKICKKEFTTSYFLMLVKIEYSYFFFAQFLPLFIFC